MLKNPKNSSDCAPRLINSLTYISYLNRKWENQLAEFLIQEFRTWQNNFSMLINSPRTVSHQVDPRQHTNTIQLRRLLLHFLGGPFIIAVSIPFSQRSNDLKMISWWSRQGLRGPLWGIDASRKLIAKDLLKASHRAIHEERSKRYQSFQGSFLSRAIGIWVLC